MAVNSFLDPTKLGQVQQNYITTFDRVNTLETNLAALNETVDNLDNNYLSLSGGTVTDTVKTTKSTFTDDDEFVTKKYVDDNTGGGSGTTVYELGMPDFSNAVEITSNLQTCHDNSTPYEIPDNGFILLKAWNGYIVMWPYNSDDNAPLSITNIGSVTSYSSMYTVKKGDKYNIEDIGHQSGGNHYAYFIPVTYSDGVIEIREIGTPDYDNRIEFTQADLPYTVPCNGYLYIGGWKSRVSLKYKDADNNYVGIAFDSMSGVIAEYGMYPVTKDMILEYNGIDGAEAKMYIIPATYSDGSVKGRNVVSLYHGSSLTNSITLNDAYTNYDEIIITSNTGIQVNSVTYNVNDISINNLIGIWINTGYIGYIVTSDTILTLSGHSNVDYIANIYGIKYDSNYITIDSEISNTSINPVQNKVLANKINELEQRIIALEGRI